MSDGPKIFCIGLPKTGTTSLEYFLENYNEQGFKIYANAYNSCLMNYFKKGKYDFSAFDCEVQSVNVFSEMPAAIFWKNFYDQYPDAKFIYTTRKKEDWLRSCQHWWKRFSVEDGLIIDNDLKKRGKFSKEVSEALSFYKKKLFGNYLYDERIFSDVYDKHHASVFKFFCDKDNFLHLPLELDNDSKLVAISDFLELDREQIAIRYPKKNRSRYKK